MFSIQDENIKKIINDTMSYYSPILKNKDVPEVERYIFNNTPYLTEIGNEESNMALEDIKMKYASITSQIEQLKIKGEVFEREFQVKDKDGNITFKKAQFRIIPGQPLQKVVIKRKSKNFPDGAYITDSDVQEEKEIVSQKYKDIVQQKFNYRNFLSYVRYGIKFRLNLLRHLCDNEEELERIIDEAIFVVNNSKEDNILFLTTKGYKNIEKYGLYESTPDGYGHTRVTYAYVDYLEKEIKIGYGSSDD